MPGGASSEPESYSSVNTYTQDAVITDETITSSGSDENAVLVLNGAEVSMKNVTLDRSSSDSTGGDAASFYGTGAGMLVTEGVLHVSDSMIDTDAAGGAGILRIKMELPMFRIQPFIRNRIRLAEFMRQAAVR